MVAAMNGQRAWVVIGAGSYDSGGRAARDTPMHDLGREEADRGFRQGTAVRIAPDASWFCFHQDGQALTLFQT
jgi:hypothetical protein